MGRADGFVSSRRAQAALILRCYLCFMALVDIVTDVGFWTESNMLELEDACLDKICSSQLAILESEVESAATGIGLSAQNYSGLFRSGIAPPNIITVTVATGATVPASIETVAQGRIAQCLADAAPSNELLAKRLASAPGGAQQCVQVASTGISRTFAVRFPCEEAFAGVQFDQLHRLLNDLRAKAKQCITSGFQVELEPFSVVPDSTASVFQATIECTAQGCAQFGSLVRNENQGLPGWVYQHAPQTTSLGGFSRCRAPTQADPVARLPSSATEFFRSYFFWSSVPPTRAAPSLFQNAVCMYRPEDMMYMGVYFGRYHREIRVLLLVSMFVKEIAKALAAALSPWFAGLRHPDRFRLVISSPMLLPLLCSSYYRTLWRVADQRPGIAGVVIDLVLEDLPQQIIQILVTVTLKATLINIISLVASALLLIPTLIKVVRGMLRSSKINAAQRTAELEELKQGRVPGAGKVAVAPAEQDGIDNRLSELERLIRDVSSRVDALEKRSVM